MTNPEVRQLVRDSQFFQPQFMQKYRQSVSSLQLSLQKQLQTRNNSDQMIMQKFLQLSPFFKQLIEQISSSFAESLVRYGKIFVLKGRRRIYSRGQKMNRIFLPLLGNFLIKADRQHPQSRQQSIRYIQNLINQGSNATNAKKISTASGRRMTAFKDNQNLSTVKAQLDELVQCDQFNNEGSLMIAGFQNQQYKESLYVRQQAWVLGIPANRINKCCEQEYERRLLVQCNQFRKLRCFDILENSQLRELILKIPLIEMKKDEYVFKEGDKSQSMYVLINGQAKAQRTVQLFKDDPNALYQLQGGMSQTSRSISKSRQFSYADFEGVYNYSPVMKKIELGIIAPVTVFGEEELMTDQPREVDVLITSQKAKMYIIFLKDLQNLYGKKVNVKQFMDALYQSITLKKIMFRRQYLSKNLELENKRNMNYFFIDSGEPLSARNRTGSAKQKINNSISPSRIKLRPSSPVKPRYTNLNFNEFVNERKSKVCYLKLTPQEDKIAQLTHSTQDIQTKVKSEWMMSQKFGFKHKINIVTPLFDTNYYRNQRKRISMIENKKRMQSFAVTPSSSSIKSSKTMILQA